MPKKKPNKKADKKVKVIDYAADENYDPLRTIIYIEHTELCPIFKIKALEFLTYLELQFPERIFILMRNNNKEGPREGAFEISISQTARTPITPIWSGIDKGPPRRDKFPDFDDLLPEITTIIKKIVIDPNAKLHFADDIDDLDAGGNDNNNAGADDNNNDGGDDNNNVED